jgi:hypothetical protein
VISITHPNRHSAGAPEEHIELIWVEGKSLRMYLKDNRLTGLKKHCRADVLNGNGYPQRVMVSYVPKDGDVIRLRRTRSIS